MLPEPCVTQPKMSQNAAGLKHLWRVLLIQAGTPVGIHERATSCYTLNMQAWSRASARGARVPLAS